jgi:ATP-dependent DNA ligase
LPFGFGSLLLGARRNHDWVYVGAVGTGGVPTFSVSSFFFR